MPAPARTGLRDAAATQARAPQRMTAAPASWSIGEIDPRLSAPALLHELFEARADAKGDAVAIDCSPEKLTYGQLEARANQLARHLRSTGVGRGDFVALLLPRSPDLYVALLGILKAGAAYVPLDCQYPTDRVSYILDDCRVHTLITTDALAAKHCFSGRRLLRMDLDRARVQGQDAERLTRAQTGTRSDDLCYVIYTSGSTGRPKGVGIEHRNACNLVRAEGKIFPLTAADRVYQGFSIAFDASVEEVWLALHAGATLVAATEQIAHGGPALSDWLSDRGVTVLSCVPTLLAMMDQDVPTVRLLILGGEACPQDLVKRWWRPGRRVVNTYGPTEATVIATYGDCTPDTPVTIGKPIPNCRVYILDERLQPAAAGQAGELCIAGAGLARGYVGRDGLTAEKFLPDPFAPAAGERLYRTGDLARFNAGGEIEFLGRLDSQVKIRGYRVELSEIEAAMRQCPDVQASVAAVRQGDAGMQQLIGYFTPHQGRTIDEDALKAHLRALLPLYMVPSIFQAIETLPTLPSGKVDRSRLPAPHRRPGKKCIPLPAFANALEETLAAVWTQYLGPAPVSPTADFFMDLGGHSLLAARMVSQLRLQREFAGLSVLDVYNFPTVRSLAAELQARRNRRGPDRQCSPSPTAPAAPAPCPGKASRQEPQRSPGVGPHGEKTAPARTPASHYKLCVFGQSVALYFLIALYSVQWFAPYLAYSWMMETWHSVLQSVVTGLGLLLGIYPSIMVFSILAKWVLIGRYKAGRYPLWGSYYFRWWLVDRILSIVPIDSLSGTGLLNAYYRLMGAKIGRNVYFDTDNVRTFDLVSVGEGTSVGNETALLGYTVADGMLTLGPITVGADCFLGVRSILSPGSEMEEAASLEDLSLLPAGGRIPAGQVWLGSPARPVANKDLAAARRAEPAYKPSAVRKAAFGLIYAMASFLLPAVTLAAILPGVLLLNHLSRIGQESLCLWLSLPVAASFVLLMSLEIALFKWLLLGRVTPGRHRLDSFFYLRKWMVDRLMALSLDQLSPLYATLYLAPWFRLLGAKLGRGAEVSTATAAVPDLLTIGDESFLADCVSLGVCRVDKGVLTMAHTQIGRRAFIGNSAVIPAGAVIGDNTLIGCLSAPPLSPRGASQANTSWMGSPAIFLPQRQASASFGDETTFKPTAPLVAQRLFIEFFRVTLPATFFIAFTCLLISAVGSLHQALPNWQAALLFPLLYAGCGLGAVAVVVAAKWILMGRYVEGEKPLWSTFVWRTELVTALHEDLADPFFVGLLLGTPWVSWFFRLLGAKIGSRVFMETTQLTEYDLITVGDDATLNSDCTLQTHLFEDRVMKMSTIHIGNGCSVGAGAIVLYSTQIHDGATLGDLSLLMKGEALPAGTRWHGAPARSADPETTASVPAAAGTGIMPASCMPAPTFLWSLDERNGEWAAPHVWVLDTDAPNYRLLASPDKGSHGRHPQGQRSEAGGCLPPEHPQASTLEGGTHGTTADRAPGLQSSPPACDRRAVGNALARRLIANCLGAEPQEVTFDTDAHGRLSLAGGKLSSRPQAASLDVNIAHSDNVFVAGITFGGRIGVDVEIVKPRLDVEPLMRDAFSPAEREQVGSLPAERRLDAFYRIWTAKEALAKLVGHGMSLGLEQIQVHLDAQGGAAVVRFLGSEQLAGNWRIIHRSAAVGGATAIVAVALEARA